MKNRIKELEKIFHDEVCGLLPPKSYLEEMFFEASKDLDKETALKTVEKFEFKYLEWTRKKLNSDLNMYNLNLAKFKEQKSTFNSFYTEGYIDGEISVFQKLIKITKDRISEIDEKFIKLTNEHRKKEI
jgi:macrodomain Ter protein organizer (MatP/YcbG family)